ncbi:MAG: DNA methyltransferase [Candidatus Bathyarchaeia archaeon]
MAKLFFLLSGESESLPAAEVKAILEAEGYRYENDEVLDQTLLLEADLSSVQTVQVRAAFTRLCALELFKSDAIETDIAEAAGNTDFKSVLKPEESFSVRINRIKNYADQAINTMRLEGKLGEIILQRTENTKVNLKSPDKTFIGIVTNEKLVFGLKITEIQTKTFSERRPRRKPFFHPSAMPSKLARCMVNLAHAKSEDLVLDPFCGTGTSLIEAIYIGCHALGVDAQKRMVLGCRKNLKHFHITPEGLVLADARQMPFIKVDCVVTDPPYGRSSSTLKSTTKQLAQEVLASTHNLLRAGQRICIALPIQVNGLGQVEHTSVEISEFVENLGFHCLESHKVYVHRTLTREIMVYEKV